MTPTELRVHRRTRLITLVGLLGLAFSTVGYLRSSTHRPAIHLGAVAVGSVTTALVFAGFAFIVVVRASWRSVATQRNLIAAAVQSGQVYKDAKRKVP